MFLKWTAELFGTGVDDIDDQHKELFDRVNRLLEACAAAKGGDEIKPLMGFLGDYIDEHFAFEEAHMAAINSPIADANRKAHDGFRVTYAQLREEVDAVDGEVDTARLLFQLQSTVCNWITSHILHTDTAMREQSASA